MRYFTKIAGSKEEESTIKAFLKKFLPKRMSREEFKEEFNPPEEFMDKYFDKTASKYDIMRIFKKNPKLRNMNLDEAQQFGSALEELRMLDDLGNMHPDLLKYLKTAPQDSKAVGEIGGRIALASYKTDNLTAEMEANEYLNKMGIANKKKKQNFGPSGQQVNSGTNVDSSGSRSNAVPVPVVDPAKPDSIPDNGGITDPEQPKPIDPAPKPDVTPGKSMNESWLGGLSNAMSSGKTIAAGDAVAADPKPVAGAK